jgi:hypothetical protein
MTDYTMLNAALDLARAGLAVFPLVPQGKAPRYKGSFRSATTDPTAITAHWRRHRNDNIAVRPPEHTIVLDVDPRHGGDAGLARLVADNGLHYWLDLGGSVGAMRGTLCKGVDIKHHDNGYVVVPPSVHPCGQRYWWRKSPRGPKPATAPPWLRRAVQRPVADRWTHSVNGMNGHGQYTLQCLVARIAAAREGTRNTTVFGALKDALRQGDLDAFGPDLAAAAHAVGLDVSEVQSIFRSVRGA